MLGVRVSIREDETLDEHGFAHVPRPVLPDDLAVNDSGIWRIVAVFPADGHERPVEPVLARRIEV